MTEFDPAKFEEKYVHYFEELETAYSNAYQALHGRYDSTVLKAVDRQVLSESEPMYEGDGQFRVELPENPRDRVSAAVAANEQFDEVLDAMTDGIERELRELFEFDNA